MCYTAISKEKEGSRWIPIYEIDLDVCPHCGGVGAIQDEQGWCVYVDCLDCGSHTVHAAYETPEGASRRPCRSRICGTLAR